MNFFEDLARLADFLDKFGFYKEADEVDETIQKKWEEFGKYPSRQFSEGQTVKWQDAFDYLKRNLQSMQAVGKLQMPSESLEEIYNAIDLTAEEVLKKSERTPFEEEIERADEKYFVPTEIIPLAENIANLREDIMKAQYMLQKGKWIEGGIEKEDLTEERQKELSQDIQEDQQKLNAQLQVMQSKVEAGSPAWNAILDYINSIGTERKVVLVPERRNIQGEI